MQNCNGLITLVARVFLSVIFISSGINKIFGWEGTAQFMAAKGMFAVPFFLFMTIVIEVGGGLSVLLGFKAKWGALALALFLVPVTLVFHGFWSFEGMEQKMQMGNFMKNFALIGGLLYVHAFGAGSISCDAKCSSGTKE